MKLSTIFASIVATAATVNAAPAEIEAQAEAQIAELAAAGCQVKGI